MNTIQQLWSSLRSAITIINLTDILDILIVTFLVYQILKLSRTKTAGQIVKAVILLLVLAYVSNFLGLNTLNFIISRVIEVGLFALVVVFQPELRRVMERLGGSSLRGILRPKNPTDSIMTLEQIAGACRTMSSQRTGALIVLERNNDLEEYFQTGTVVNADVSEELLKNIFFPKAALHDGAVVIREDRIAAAGCVLPLTENPNLSRDLGTRHRAAIGMSEHSDAVVVVVSEETGVISCAIGGDLTRYLTPEALLTLLITELAGQNIEQSSNWYQSLLGRLGIELDGGKHDEK